MSPLSAAEILSAWDRPILEVEVPEWGGPVCIALMSVADVKEWRQLLAARAPEDQDDIIADLLVMTLTDAAGQRLFRATDIKALNDKSAVVLDRLFRAAVAHNRLGNAEVEKAKGES